MLSLYIMNNKGYGVLSEILKHFDGEFVDQVICSRDFKVENDYYEDIINLCKENNVLYTERTEEKSVKSKYSFAIGWRWLIHKPMGQLIIFHDSLLPKYRGFAPLVSYLISGEERLGVTALFAKEEFDKGEIISQKSVKITYPLKIKKAIEIIIPLYQNIAIEICKKIKSNDEIIGVPQDHSNATYSLWRDENDYRINWFKSAKYIKRFIDAVGYPYKGASVILEGKKARILKAEDVLDVAIHNRDVGKVIFIKDNFPIVVCKEGLLKITEMIDDETKLSLLPLNKFRIRFGD